MISENQRKITELYTAIGKSYYENHQDDLNAEEQQDIDVIKKIYAQIEQCQEQIKQIKGVTSCPKCGGKIAYGSVFCSKCGAQIFHTETSDNQPVKMRMCSKCGVKINDDSAFCVMCGTKL